MLCQIVSEPQIQNIFFEMLLINLAINLITFEVKGGYLPKKFINFKAPVIFWKWKLCRECAAGTLPNLLIFWNLPPKHIPDRQNMFNLKNPKKC